MSDEEDEPIGGEGGGEGKEVYPYGQYEGGRDDNLDRHGSGRAILPNGDIYRGNYHHGLRMGKGLYCFRNGARYDGEWRKGQKHGYGTFYYPDGSKYVGEWRKDLKHGHGTYYYINGDTYEGPWYLGYRHGLGTYTYKSEGVTHYGMWINGRMEGPATVNYPGYQYHGKCSKNLPKGPGCFTFENKWMQHGFYVNMRDPAFDYVGAEDLALAETKEEAKPEDRSNPRGIVPIWRARSITPYQPELLPDEPTPLPIKDSLDSLIDIMDYLSQQYKVEGEIEENASNLNSPVPIQSEAEH